MRNRQIAMIPLLIITVALAFCAFTAIGWQSRVARAEAPKTEGALWLSWNTEAKGTYVAGYLRGFQRGKREACSFYEDKVEAPPPVPVEKLPMQVCLKSLPEFTEPYYQAYVDKMTEYYRKYPNDREAGLSELMTNLATPPGLSVDQIHAKLGGNSKRQ